MDPNGLYYVWLITFVLFCLLGAFSFRILVRGKKQHFPDLCQEDLDCETFVTPADRRIFYELTEGMPKWVGMEDNLRKFYFLFKWSKRFATVTFVVPPALILLIYFLDLR